MTPQENRPPLAPSDFAKILLNRVVGNSENPNNLSSANVLQLVRQGVSKPEFMQEYLKSGGIPPQYSVLTDSEYRDAYRTDQVPDTRPMPNPMQPDYEMPTQPDYEPIVPSQPDYVGQMPTQDEPIVPSQPDYDPYPSQPDYVSLPDGSQSYDLREFKDPKVPAPNPMMQTYVPPAVNPPMAQYVPPVQQPQPQPTFVPYQAPIPQVASEGLMGVPVMPSYNPAMYQAPTLPTTPQSYASIMQRLLRGPEIV